MARRLKTLGLFAAVAAGALLPLYGDPRPSPVTHPEWARMVLRALDLLDSTIQVSDQASQAFSTLSWKNSLAFRADRYVKGQGVEVLGGGGQRRVRATGEVGEVAYPLAVVRGGEYRVRLRLAGRPSAPAEAEIRAVGAASPTKSFTVVPATVEGWVDAGTAHLSPGAYSASVLLPRDTELEYVEFAPPCVSSIEPIGGWKPTAITQTEDVAVTVLKALDLESELPPAALPVERRGADFQAEEMAVAAAPAPVGVEELWLKAGPEGQSAGIFVELPEPGLYALSVFGVSGGGQSWLADACKKAVICPDTTDTSARWRTIMSGEFAAGRHFFNVTLGPGASVGRLKVERKKESGADYMAAVRRLGLDLGPEGPITRDKAVEAMNFIKRRRSLSPVSFCGDIVRRGVLAASAALAEPAQPAGPAQPLNPGPGVLPNQPPVLPPQQVASPIVP